MAAACLGSSLASWAGCQPPWSLQTAACLNCLRSAVVKRKLASSARSSLRQPAEAGKHGRRVSIGPLGGLLKRRGGADRIQPGERLLVRQLAVAPEGLAVADLQQAGDLVADLDLHLQAYQRDGGRAEFQVVAAADQLLVEELDLLVDAGGDRAAAFQGPHGGFQDGLGLDCPPARGAPRRPVEGRRDGPGADCPRLGPALSRAAGRPGGRGPRPAGRRCRGRKGVLQEDRKSARWEA